MTQRGIGNPRAWMRYSLVALLAWGSAGAVSAQTAGKPRPAFPDEFGRAFERARRQVETLHMLRLSEKLGLNVEQSAQLAAVVRKAQEARRRLLDERRQIIEELGAVVDAGGAPERIKPKVAQWEENESRLGRWRQGLFLDLTRMLSIEQQARYLLFEENFDSEVRNAILELRGPRLPQAGE